jgi:hypothetical protein
MSARDEQRYFAALRKQRHAAEQARALRKLQRRLERDEQKAERTDEARIAAGDAHHV